MLKEYPLTYPGMFIDVLPYLDRGSLIRLGDRNAVISEDVYCYLLFNEFEFDIALKILAEYYLNKILRRIKTEFLKKEERI